MTSNSRAAALSEAADALTAKACQLSEQAEEEMRRDLEDQAQVWHEAAAAVRRLINRPSRVADETATTETEPECARCGHSRDRHMGDAHERGCHVCWDSPGNSGWNHRFEDAEQPAAGSRQDGAQP